MSVLPFICHSEPFLIPYIINWSKEKIAVAFSLVVLPVLNHFKTTLNKKKVQGSHTYILRLTDIAFNCIVTSVIWPMIRPILPLHYTDCDLPSMYWNPKLHKNPYKQYCIAESAKCTTKPLSKLVTSILTAVKEGLQSYHNTCYSHSGVNSMWILKNQKIFWRP